MRIRPARSARHCGLELRRRPFPVAGFEKAPAPVRSGPCHCPAAASPLSAAAQSLCRNASGGPEPIHIADLPPACRAAPRAPAAAMELPARNARLPHRTSHRAAGLRFRFEPWDRPRSASSDPAPDRYRSRRIRGPAAFASARDQAWPGRPASGWSCCGSPPVAMPACRRPPLNSPPDCELRRGSLVWL